MPIINKQLTSSHYESGLNSHFCCEGMSFKEYIDFNSNMIAQARMDLNCDNAQQIIAENSPFELQPQQNSSIRKGMLLIHGLYSSPAHVRDLAKHYVAQGILVRAILLPGHGTVPGDLLSVKYHEWIKATKFGIDSFINEVDELYITGISTGACLAAYQASLDTANIKSLVLISPAFGLRSRFAPITRFHKHAALLNEKLNWYLLAEQEYQVQYQSLTVNSAFQIYSLTRKLKRVQAKLTKLPQFLVVSQTDETISPGAVLKYFHNLANPHNRLLVYGNQLPSKRDPHIIYRATVNPELSILDYSHGCIAISPDNQHFGKHGQYQALTFLKKNHHKSDRYYGALSTKNIAKYSIEKLTYNPDFNNMLVLIDEFIAKAKIS